MLVRGEIQKVEQKSVIIITWWGQEPVSHTAATHMETVIALLCCCQLKMPNFLSPPAAVAFTEGTKAMGIPDIFSFPVRMSQN